MRRVTAESEPVHGDTFGSMWDTESGRRIWECVIVNHGFPCVAISHSGKKVVIWGADQCQVRDATSGAIISCWNHLQPRSVAFSPDEAQIIANTYQTATWDIESGTRISEGWNPSSLPRPFLVDTSNKRRHPVVLERWTLTLHNTVSGTSTVISEELDRSIRLPVFSSEGSKIAALVADTFVHVWDSYSGNLLAKSPALKNGPDIRGLIFSPDGNVILTLPNPQRNFGKIPSMSMWHVNDDDNPVTVLDDVNSAAFFPNTPRMVTMSSVHHKLRIWDISPTPRLLSTLTLTPTKDEKCLAISCDGTRLLTNYSLWDIGDFPLKELVSFFATSGMFSHDSKLVAFTNLDGTYILDAVTGDMHHHSDFSVRSLSFSPDSNQFYGFGIDQTCMLVMCCSPTSGATSVDEYIKSCVWHPDFMMMSELQRSPWYYGVSGARIIWLQENMRPVWLATGEPGFRSRYLVLGRTANDITILDMGDYLEGLPVQGTWREGGIRYADFAEVERASALASASRLPVRIPTFSR